MDSTPAVGLPSLVAGAAHDYQNLLLVLRAHVDRAASALPADHAAQNPLAAAEAAIEEAARLSRTLQRLARSPSGTRSEVDLTELLRDSERLLRRLLPPTITLSQELPGAPLLVEDDPVRVQWLLVELVAAERDALRDGGRLRLRVRRERRDDEREEAVLRVESLDGAGEGREVRLPLVPTPPGRSSESGSGALLLLAGADPFLRDVLTSSLERAGYRVRTADDGRSALAAARDAAAELRSAVLDESLLDGSGGELRRTLGRELPGLRILLLAGGGFAGASRAPGEDPVLVRPFTMDRLVAAVRDTLAASS